MREGKLTDSALVRATIILIDAMTFEERKAVADRIAAYGAMKLPNGSEVTRFVSDLFADGQVWATDHIIGEAADAAIEGSPKQIYNALGYLTRRNAIKRLGYDRYVALAAPDSAGRLALAAQEGGQDA